MVAVVAVAAAPNGSTELYIASDQGHKQIKKSVSDTDLKMSYFTCSPVYKFTPPVLELPQFWISRLHPIYLILNMPGHFQGVLSKTSNHSPTTI